MKLLLTFRNLRGEVYILPAHCDEVAYLERDTSISVPMAMLKDEVLLPMDIKVVLE